jgi:hypothetical protein
MTPLPNRVDFDYLKKQAKDLIRLYRGGDRTAITRFLRASPVAANRTPEEIAASDCGCTTPNLVLRSNMVLRRGPT